MHARLFSVFILAATLQGFSQTAATTEPALPKEPRAVFAAAAPFYDFTDAALKPWHLKATYQLYDDKGKHPETGSYEYWWVSPREHRSTWTRQGFSHTDWYTADGKYAYESIGEPMKLFEYKLQSALLSPLPSSGDLDPAKFRLDDENVTSIGTSGPCFTVAPRMKQGGAMAQGKDGQFPTYCFESQKLVLRTVYSYERASTRFDTIVQTQGKNLAREIEIEEGKHKFLVAKVDIVDEISPSDPALMPSKTAIHTDLWFSGATTLNKVDISKEVAVGFLIKKVEPIYPSEAKKARIQGTVVMRATIGTDGKVHDLLVLSAPSALLAAASFRAASQWEYKPYLLNGQPVPVETTINVYFALGG